VAAAITVLGWIMLHKDRPVPSPAAGKITSPAAAPAPPPPVTLPVMTPPPPAPAPTTPALEGVDARFIAFLRNNDPDSFFVRIDNSTAIADAHLVCKDMLHGVSTQNVADKLEAISTQDFAWFVDTATANYCPQYVNY
jgi:hypothetical protein